MGLDALHPSPHGGCSWKPGAPHKDSRHAIATCSHVLRDAQQLSPWPPTKATGMVGTWGGGGGDEAGSVQAPQQARVPTIFLGPVDQLGIHPLNQLPMAVRGQGHHALCVEAGRFRMRWGESHPCHPSRPIHVFLERPPPPHRLGPSCQSRVSRRRSFQEGGVSVKVWVPGLTQSHTDARACEGGGGSHQGFSALGYREGPAGAMTEHESPLGRKRQQGG